MPTWSEGINLRGNAGSPGADGASGTPGISFTSGTSDPGGDYGNVNDTYLNRSTRQFFVKNNFGWTSAGLAYNLLTVGTAVPGTNYGYDSDVYIRVNAGTTTLYQKSGITWSVLATLTGASGTNGTNGTNGAAGLSVLSGSGAPSSSLGVVGQPGYVDSTGLVIYGAKTSSGWPAGVSIAPIKGDKGDVGPASPGLRSGSGVPTSSNPSYQVDGDYYIRNDVSPTLLYGPRASGVWPTTAQNTGGSQTQTCSGPPASTLGAVGDVAVDLTNALWYPPKTNSGWTTAPINMVGPTGPAGATTLLSQSAGNGVTVSMSGFTLATTAASAFYPGTTQVAPFVPVFGTQLMGYSITNVGSAITLSLVNTTTPATIYTTSIAANVTTGTYFSLGTYPMAGNQNYQWQVSGSGTASFCLTPMYLMPAASPGFNISNLPSVGQSTSTTFSSTALQLKYPGTTVGNAYRLPKGGYLYAATLQNLSTAALTFTLNYSTNAGSSYAALYSLSVPANSTSNVGPFSVNTYATASASVVYWSVTGTGTGTCFADTQIVYLG